MHNRIYTILTAALTTVCAHAAVPLKWTVETSRVQPVTFEAYHGETLALEATLQSYGKPVSDTLQDARIYWQTNGMGSAYWSAPASASGNVLRATWTPAMDTGANAVYGFIGVSGEIYRASFQLRMRSSPGAVPNELELPRKHIDFAEVEVKNAPWASATIVHAVFAAADNARMTATNALAKATAAQSSADAAQRSADAAQTSADNAQAVAADAQSAAEAAQEEVGAVRLVLAGEDFRITITNYNSKVHPPELSMEARYSDGTTQRWDAVWSETNGLARTKRETLAEVRSNHYDKAESDARYKAWGQNDGYTGAAAPDGFAQYSGPGGLIIGADSGWKNYVSAGGGSYWIWSGNGNVTTSQATGTLDILDSDGNAALSVVKGDKTLESAAAASIAKSSDGVNDIVTIVYNVKAEEAPVLEFSAELKPATWIKQTDEGFPGSVAWTTEGNVKWTAVVTLPANVRGFFRATYWKGKENYIRSIKSMALDGGIIIDGVKFALKVVEINGVKVLGVE